MLTTTATLAGGFHFPVVLYTKHTLPPTSTRRRPPGAPPLRTACCRLNKKEEGAAFVDVDVEAARNSLANTAAVADVVPSGAGAEDDGVNYMARAQWLRAAVLGANDGLVSVASLMIGIGAVNTTAKAMLVSGLAGLVAGACSMAIGDADGADDADGGAKENLPSPTLAAFASALAFALGGLLPLLAGGFIKSWAARVGAVCAASSIGLAGFGASGGYLGGANIFKSATRVLLGGWLAMLVTYGVLRLFGTLFHMDISSSGFPRRRDPISSSSVPTTPSRFLWRPRARLPGFFHRLVVIGDDETTSRGEKAARVNRVVILFEPAGICFHGDVARAL
ncbi:hypothetical protein GUJ93_ZPchr0014g46580 [Zizania palustris]|uniref:Uncharacterized protein n=1 Tax=Zizania palustris TaxID=103762 RepID=A0A8J5W5W0_ZIZPA|nr:hypothetical protein GUJ93_ZPchr0014g46580 [Zizania palustris]